MNNHQHCQELLPWYANGTLNELEMAMCSTHVEQCDECREDLQTTISQMQELNLHPAPVQHQTSPQVDRLMAALGPRESRSVQRWPVALAATAVVVSAMLMTVVTPQPAGFRLLTNATEASYFVQVAFQPGTREEQIRQFVLDSGGTVAGNPTAAGIYRLEFSAPLSSQAFSQIKTASVIAWASKEL